MVDDLENKIRENADGPAKASGDAGSIEQHKLVEQIADGVFSDKSPTFSKGMIGTWKEKLPESMKDEFKQHAQEWLVEFGYETDDNW